ncbi:hypothetical protein D1007_48264 [Hordeum vulgare]|nr:hypothetical protein D1007_48264 [Hordeum vulgare]
MVGRGRGRWCQLPDLNVAACEDVEENGEAHTGDPMHGEKLAQHRRAILFGNNPQPPQPREWSDIAKLTAYVMLLERTSLGIMKRGVTKEVSRLTGMPHRTVHDLRNKGKLYGGMLGVFNKKPKNCGHKRIAIDSESMKVVNNRKRTTIKDLANELNVSKTMVWRRLKEK